MVETFGKYILLEKLASGGMAEVYLARSTGANGINKFLAVKRILPQYSDHPEFIEMFKEEAKIAVNLNHGNVVSIFDFGIERNQFFLVMEFVEGQNLRQILNHMKREAKDFSIDQIVYVIKEVAAGLDHAHRCLDGATGRPLNITHRDMSPQNVMLSFEGEVKVVDFGIAKAENQMENTRAGTIKGKFGYMSPEQADGQPVDLRTDIFSLGIVLWELLAKDRLFVAQSEAATLRRVRECQIPSLRKINPNIPPELERICNKALAKDRSLRYQTAAAFHKDLNRFLNLQYPEFSTQEFSKFMKSIYNKMYVENRKKFAEYAKINADDDKTAVTQTATVTATATDTDLPANTYKAPAPPNRNVAINAPDDTNSSNEDEEGSLHGIEADTSSKVDFSALKTSELKTSPKLTAALNEANKTSITSTGASRAGHTHTGIGSKTRIPQQSSFMPTYIIGGIIVLAGVGFFMNKNPNSALSARFNKIFGSSRDVAGTSAGSIGGNKADISGVTESPSKDPASPAEAKVQPTQPMQPPAPAGSGEQVPLAIHSQPSRAIVYIDGVNRGFTPYRGWIEKGKAYRVSLVKDEYLPNDRGEVVATSSEGLTIRATLQAEPPGGFIGIEVIHGGSDPVVSVNGMNLTEKLPVERYRVPAGVPVKIRAYNPASRLYAEETVTVGVGQKRQIRLILGRSAQSR